MKKIIFIFSLLYFPLFAAEMTQKEIDAAISLFAADTMQKEIDAGVSLLAAGEALQKKIGAKIVTQRETGAGIPMKKNSQVHVQENIDALIDMGIRLCREKRYSEAIPYLERAAMQGNKNSQAYVANAYYYGIGIKRDLSVSMEWAIKADGFLLGMNGMDEWYSYLIDIIVSGIGSGNISIQDIQKYIIPVRKRNGTYTNPRMRQIMLRSEHVIYGGRDGTPMAVMKRRNGIIYPNNQSLPEGDYRIVGIEEFQFLFDRIQIPLIEKVK